MSDEIKRHGSLENMGAAEFTIICEPTEVRLMIHGHHVVARTQENVYERLFDHCKNIIESQSDDYSIVCRVIRDVLRNDVCSAQSLDVSEDRKRVQDEIMRALEALGTVKR